MKRPPPPWPLQNKSFSRTPCALNLHATRLRLRFLLLRNQGVQPQPPDFDNNWAAGRSRPDGVGVVEGGGVDVLPGKRFVKIQTAHHFQNEFASWFRGHFPTLLYCFAFSLKGRKRTREIAVNAQKKYTSGIKNVPSAEIPSSARQGAVRRGLQAVASLQLGVF